MGFGTWNLRDVAPRKVKSIRGGNQITIPARKRVGFSVGAVLAQAAQPHKAKSSGTTRPTATAGSATRPGPTSQPTKR